MQEAHVCSVSELVSLAARLLEQHFTGVWVCGEISDLTIHRSGHVYFSIKDENSQLRAIMFRGAALAQQLRLERGMSVNLYGRLTLYGPQSTVQIQVMQISPVGVGDLYLRFEELKRRLAAEGLFDSERKRPIPVLPQCIGLITSLDGAAIQDFFNVINRRFPGMHVRVVPCAVQGAGAAAQVAGAVQFLNQQRACDVIVVTRGGGSLEDLWPFNEEVLARAVAASEIPVISAIGHERDFSICDYAADFRAPTPSAAAELVVKSRMELLGHVQELRQRLTQALLLTLSGLQNRVLRVSRCTLLQHPEELVFRRSQRLDMLSARLEQTLPRQAERLAARLDGAAKRLPLAIRNRMSQTAHRLDSARQTLQALAPQRVLERGYSILLSPQGQAIRSKTEVIAGEQLTALLAHGSLHVAVTQSEGENHE